MPLTTRSEWFQTVPLTKAIEPDFDAVEYLGDFEIDEDARQDIDWILKESVKIAALLKKRGDLSKLPKTKLREIAEYKEAIRDLSRYPLCDVEDDGLNDKIDEIDDSGCGNYWELLGTYKGFQIFISICGGNVLVSQADGPCFETRDGWNRFLDFDSDDERLDAAIADAQEFIDSFVLSRRNDDPEYDWNVLGRLQLSLPL